MSVEPNKNICKIIVEMIDSGLISYKHYYLWCDSIIEILENPPYWILELAVTKNSIDARKIVFEYEISGLMEIYKPFQHYYSKYIS